MRERGTQSTMGYVLRFMIYMSFAISVHSVSSFTPRRLFSQPIARRVGRQLHTISGTYSSRCWDILRTASIADNTVTMTVASGVYDPIVATGDTPSVFVAAAASSSTTTATAIAPTTSAKNPNLTAASSSSICGSNKKLMQLRGGGIGLKGFFASLSTAVEGMGPAAPFGFAAAYVGCEMLGVPPGALVVFAGAFFGVVAGTALALANGLLSATACFYVGRAYRSKFLAWLSTRENAYKQFTFIDRVIARGGFRALTLLRLVPTPIPGMNYFYGVTGVDFAPYIGATALGYLPGTAVLAYSGAAGKSLFSGSSFTVEKVLKQPWYYYIIAVTVASMLAKAINDIGKTIMMELNQLSE